MKPIRAIDLRHARWDGLCRLARSLGVATSDSPETPLRRDSLVRAVEDALLREERRSVQDRLRAEQREPELPVIGRRRGGGGFDDAA